MCEPLERVSGVTLMSPRTHLIWAQVAQFGLGTRLGGDGLGCRLNGHSVPEVFGCSESHVIIEYVALRDSSWDIQLSDISGRNSLQVHD